MRLAILAIVWIASSSCSGGGGLTTGASPVVADVEFVYTAAENPSCRSGVARLYPSWWGFTHATMIPTAVRSGQQTKWAALFENVPIGRQSVRVAPPEGCEQPSLVVNGVSMTAANDKLVFSFAVHPDGSVTH